MLPKREKTAGFKMASKDNALGTSKENASFIAGIKI